MFDCMPWRKHLHAADDIFICILVAGEELNILEKNGSFRSGESTRCENSSFDFI